mmetsp:Transcript_667/g.1203  ORF Transcript_667/g.1203 Transcript_667/m.1203 type:complete len:663 (-) Transcript_667:51-2039(-)
MDSEVRGPLPRFEANAGREKAEPLPPRENWSQGMRLVSEEELTRERSFWSDKLQTDVMRLQTGCYERMQELLSIHESRMKSELRTIVESDSVQGDSGGSREGTAALGSRMSVLELKLTTEQGKVSSALEKLEEVKTAMSMLGLELAEARKDREDIGQLAQMAINTTRCLTEMPSVKNFETPGSGTGTPSTAADTADGRIWEQLAGRLGAISKELRSEVRSDLLVALRTEFQAEMARKMATFQSRIVALEASIGGTVTKVMADVSERVSNLEAAQADATQVRERLLALEESKGRSTSPKRWEYLQEYGARGTSREADGASFGSNLSGNFQVEDINFTSSSAGYPVRTEKVRSGSPIERLPKGGYSPMSTVLKSNIYDRQASADTANSGMEENMSVGDSANDDMPEEGRANLMSHSLKSELEGLVDAVSSIISDKPKSAGNTSRQASVARPGISDRAHQQRAVSAGAKAKPGFRKAHRSTSPYDPGTGPTSSSDSKPRHQSLDFPQMQHEASNPELTPRTKFEPLFESSLSAAASPGVAMQSPQPQRQPSVGCSRPNAMNQPKAASFQRVISPGAPNTMSPDAKTRGLSNARYNVPQGPRPGSVHVPVGASVAISAAYQAANVQAPGTSGNLGGNVRPVSTQGTTVQPGSPLASPQSPNMRSMR